MSGVDRFLATARGPLGAAAARIVSLDDLRAQRGQLADAPSAPQLSLDQLAGRMLELSAQGASATLSTAIGLVLQAQTSAEPVAWIGLATSSFYPPDLADSGVDLAALVVVRAPDATAILRTAERLLRSGAFGLVILDGGRGFDVPLVAQGRLAGLAQQHDAVVVCLTEKSSEAASVGSMVSLRIEAMRHRAPGGGGQLYRCAARALKDKRRGPGWTVTESLRAPAGMS